MEKKLSELLKLVISDCHLVRKFYYDDSIMTSSQAFILCDQLAGLSAIDFSFCFKQNSPIIAPLLLNDSDIDVIDLTPFLSYKSKHVKQPLRDQNFDDENRNPSPPLSAVNELKPLHPSEREMVPLEKYKLEVEQRKYFEELLRHRDRELQQLKIRFENLKSERESEIIQMENIILELQLELRSARDDADFKRKKHQQQLSVTPPKKRDNRKTSSPTTPTNDQDNDDDDDTQMRSLEHSLTRADVESSNVGRRKQASDLVHLSSRRSSHSTTTTNTDDDQYELVRPPPLNSTNNQMVTTDVKPTSSPEMLSSATSLSTPSSSSDEDEPKKEKKLTPTTTDNTKPPVINESGRFEPVEMTAEQATLLQEESTSA